jgi:hypothetical protein
MGELSSLVKAWLVKIKMNSMQRSLFVFCLAVCAVAAGAQSSGKPADDADAKAQQKARFLLDAMEKALGGENWLSLRNSYVEGRTSGFYQGKPTGEILNFYTYRVQPDQERMELSKKRDVVEIFTGKECWEVTYKGKKALPKDQCDDYLRRRDHSIETVVRTWVKDPGTILIYEGQSLAERHLADQVTLISSSNDSITIQLDATTHLPLKRTFQWRDPVYKDKNEDAEEFDDYHMIQGIPTPFAFTRFHNGDMTNQRFLFKAEYNVNLPPNAFDVDATAAKIKK